MTNQIGRLAFAFVLLTAVLFVNGCSKSSEGNKLPRATARPGSPGWNGTKTGAAATPAP